MPPFPIPRLQVAGLITSMDPPTWKGRGVSAITRDGEGQVTLTLDQELDAANGVPIGSVMGDTADAVSVQLKTDSTLQVNTVLGGVAADAPVGVVVVPTVAA